MTTAGAVPRRGVHAFACEWEYGRAARRLYSEALYEYHEHVEAESEVYCGFSGSAVGI
jgi:hypothetical protein